MTNGGNAIDWIREKIFGQPQVPVFGPPLPRPRPVQVGQPTNANTSLVPSEQPQASLVSSVNHPKGRAQDSGSLVSGR